MPPLPSENRQINTPKRMEPENRHGDGEGNQNAVFVDTSLDTHLATIVSDSDTVSDLKRKIVLQHRMSFPATGDIKIDALKVKLRGIYYYLQDSMPVKCAFAASENGWFLSADASHLQHHVALPWVKDRPRSVDEGPSKMSLFHGSPSKHPKIVVNQEVPSLDGKVSKNIEKDRSANVELDLEQQLECSKEEEQLCSVDKERKSKKRAECDQVQAEGPEEKKSKRSRKSKKSARDQAATVVPLIVEEVGPQTNTEASEVIPVVAMVVETNIQQEMKEKCNELFEEANIRNEIPSSSLMKHADDVVVEMSTSTVHTLVIAENIIDEHKNAKTNNIISDGNSRKETAGSRIKKKDVGKSLKKDKIKKHSSDHAATGMNEGNHVPSFERKESVRMTSTDVLHVDKDAEISKTSQLNAEVSENQNVNVDATKKRKRKKKSKNEGESQTIEEDDDKLKAKDVQISTRAHSDMPSKVESEPEPKKSKIPQETSKNLTETVSQAPKGSDVNSDVGIPKEEGPHEITPFDNVDSRKDTKISHVEEEKPKEEEDKSVIQSRSRNENNKVLSSKKKIPEADGVVVVKDQKAPNITEMKKQKRTIKIDALKTTEPAQVVKKIAKHEQTTIAVKKDVTGVKSLLKNTPGTIFGDTDNDKSDDSSFADDDSASGKSSSSGESDFSMDSRSYEVKRNEGGGNKNINSQSGLENTSITDVLRRSSRFKKAIAIASQQDAESQPVDFVPESQPNP